MFLVEMENIMTEKGKKLTLSQRNDNGDGVF